LVGIIDDFSIFTDVIPDLTEKSVADVSIDVIDKELLPHLI